MHGLVNEMFNYDVVLCFIFACNSAIVWYGTFKTLSIREQFVFIFADIPWLLLPGLCCIGIAGLGTLATNLQVHMSVLLYVQLDMTEYLHFSGPVFQHLKNTLTFSIYRE